MPGHNYTRSSAGQGLYFPPCPAAPARKTAPRKARWARINRCWRVVLLRHKGQILGMVEAPDAALSKRGPAAVQFDLDEVQRNRIMVQELA